MKITKQLLILVLFFGISACGTDKKEESIKFFKRGNVKIKEGEFADAVHWFDESLIQDPKFADAYNNRGLAYQKIEKIDEAIQDFNKAIELDKKYWEAYYNRAEALFLKGDYTNASINLEKIAIPFKDSSFYYVTRGNVKVQLQNTSGATADYEKAIQLNPKNAEAYSNHGYIYFENKEFALAKKDFQKAIQLNPKQDFALNNLAYILANENKNEEALKYINQALAINPSQPYYLNNKGLILIGLDKLEEAREIIEKSIRLDDKNPLAYQNLGLYYEKKGDKIKSKENYDLVKTMR